MRELVLGIFFVMGALGTLHALPSVEVEAEAEVAGREEFEAEVRRLAVDWMDGMDALSEVIRRSNSTIIGVIGGALGEETDAIVALCDEAHEAHRIHWVLAALGLEWREGGHEYFKRLNLLQLGARVLDLQEPGLQAWIGETCTTIDCSMQRSCGGGVAKVVNRLE